MMGEFGDPGKWILVALVASIHVTRCIARRSPHHFQLRGLLPAIALLVALDAWGGWYGMAWSGAPAFLDSPSVVFYIPLACGLYLACRNRNQWVSLGYALAGFLVFAQVKSAVDEFGKSAPYGMMNLAGPSWDLNDRSRTIPDVLRNIRNLPANQALPSGYVDAMSIGQKVGISPKPIRMPIATILWHTPITTLESYRVMNYRLWIPGGSPEYAASHSQLVPLRDRR
jgi:hypothetical protein